MSEGKIHGLGNVISKTLSTMDRVEVKYALNAFRVQYRSKQPTWILRQQLHDLMLGLAQNKGPAGNPLSIIASSMTKAAWMVGVPYMFAYILVCSAATYADALRMTAVDTVVSVTTKKPVEAKNLEPTAATLSNQTVDSEAESATDVLLRVTHFDQLRAKDHVRLLHLNQAGVASIPFAGITALATGAVGLILSGLGKVPWFNFLSTAGTLTLKTAKEIGTNWGSLTDTSVDRRTPYEKLLTTELLWALKIMATIFGAAIVINGVGKAFRLPSATAANLIQKAISTEVRDPDQKTYDELKKRCKGLSDNRFSCLWKSCQWNSDRQRCTVPQHLKIKYKPSKFSQKSMKEKQFDLLIPNRAKEEMDLIPNMATEESLRRAVSSQETQRTRQNVAVPRSTPGLKPVDTPSRTPPHMYM